MIDFDSWLQDGISNGWVGPAICFTHDGLPTSQSEDEQFEESDPCIHILRLYEDPSIKVAVEENHAPSMWRATNNNFEL